MSAQPSVPGVLTSTEVAATGAAIADMQTDSGALPWFPGGKTDPWDHIESAMALSVTGFIDEAEAAYGWSRRTQRADGSWPIEFRGDTAVDVNTDSNFCAYVAVGVWHHFLITGDDSFVQAMWPTVRRAIDLVCTFQRPDGAFRWAQDYGSREMFDEALPTGNASIFHALDCAIVLSEYLGQQQDRWKSAHAELSSAFAERIDVFKPPSEHSMDWYYPVLGGPLRGAVGRQRIDERWSEFVVAGKGIRCVNHRPWVTGAETSELVLALDALGEYDRAVELFASIQHLRDPDGAYWTGLVYADGKRWPVEKSCWTSAAVVLAADALSRTSGGNGIFRDVTQREMTYSAR